jgi:hypothetical protein
MILGYLGINKTVEEICDLCDFDSRGTFETTLSLALFSLGITSTIFVVPDGSKIWCKYATSPRHKVVNSLRQRSRRSKKAVQKRGFQELADVVEKSLICFDIPSLKKIEEELDVGNPWIVCVKAYPFYNIEDKDKADLYHFVVIQGYDGDNFIINDPSFKEGGVYSMSKDRVLYSMYSSRESAICVEVNSVTDIRSDELILEGRLD